MKTWNQALTTFYSNVSLSLDVDKLHAMIEALESLKYSSFATTWSKDTLYELVVNIYYIYLHHSIDI